MSFFKFFWLYAKTSLLLKQSLMLVFEPSNLTTYLAFY